MSTAPTAQEQFDEQASNILTAVYLTPDVVAQREKVLALLAPKQGERALELVSLAFTCTAAAGKMFRVAAGYVNGQSMQSRG